jgi:hypothetical protein
MSQHPPKAPQFGVTQQGMVSTTDAVQIGCAYCLGEGLLAPAEGHVAYLWSGTSFCSKHLIGIFEAARNQQ